MRKTLKELGLVLFAGVVAFGAVTLAMGKRRPHDEFTGRLIPDLVVQRYGEDSLTRVPVSERPTLLLLFDEECAYCKTQTAGWQRLAHRAVPFARVIAISTRPIMNIATDSLLMNASIEYLGASTARQLQTQFGINGVPATILIDGRHRIQEVRDGLLEDLSLAEFYDLIRRLPSQL